METNRDLNKLPYEVTTELAYNPNYNLSRQDIYDLGFLRSNPTRFLYQHKDKPYLYLLEKTGYNVGIRDFVEEWIEIYKYEDDNDNPIILYNSNSPNKEQVQLIIDNN